MVRKGMIIKSGIVQLERPKIKLDVKDWKLMFSLSQNSRAGLKTLAKNTGLSTEGVRYKIARLQKLGVLIQRIPICNPYALGFHFYSLFLRLENLTEEKEEEILQYLAEHPYTIWGGSLLGNWDIATNVFVRNEQHLEILLTDLKKICAPLLTDILVLPIISILNYHNLPPAMATDQGFKITFVPKDGSFEELFKKRPAIKTDKKVKVDNLDVQILTLLNQDAARPLASIAKQTHVTIDTVKNHIQKLIKEEVILSFNPVFNLSLIGIQAYVLFIKKNHGAGDATVLEAFLREYTSYPLKTLGSWDYVIFLGARNEVEFYHLLRTMRNNFGKFIASFATLNVLQDVKSTFFPEGIAKDLEEKS